MYLFELRQVHFHAGNMLFFGCRSQQADFFFAQEWQPLVMERKLELFTAFSRDQDQKVYVQHRMEEEGRAVWEWVQQRKACVFIAG